METALFSPRRIIHWSNSVVNQKNEYFPEPSTNSSHIVTDKYIQSRIGVFIEDMLLLPHDDLMKNDNRLHQLGVEADLPDNVIRISMIFVRSLFEPSGKLTDGWREFQKDLRRHERGWYELITRLGFYIAAAMAKGEFTPNPASQLAEFFKVYYANFQEYSAYLQNVNKSVGNGEMVAILKPKEFFKAKSKGDLTGKEKQASDDGMTAFIR